MNKKLIIATGVTAALMTAAPVFADTGVAGHAGLGLGIKPSIQFSGDRSDDSSSSHGIGGFVRTLAHDFNRGGKDNDNDKDDDRGATSTPATTTIAVSGTVSQVNGTTLVLSAKDGTTYAVNAVNASVKGGALADIAVGDTISARGTLSGTVITATSIVDKTFFQRFMSTINDIRAGVVTAVSSTGLTLNPFGTSATTSVNTNASTTVYVHGKATTTAATTGQNVLIFGTSSTSTPNTFTASVIVILDKGLNFFKHILSL